MESYPVEVPPTVALATIETDSHADGYDGELQLWRVNGGRLVASGQRRSLLWDFDVNSSTGRLVVTYGERLKCLSSNVAHMRSNEYRLTIESAANGPVVAIESLAPWLVTVDRACEEAKAARAIPQKLALLGPVPWSLWDASGDMAAGIGDVTINNHTDLCHVDVERTAGTWRLASVQCHSR